MPYPEKTFPLIYLDDQDSKDLKDDYQAAINAQGNTQIAKSLQVVVGVAFIIPAALDAAYIAADQAKKEVMARISQEAMASAQDFDTYYTNRYNELYP